MKKSLQINNEELNDLIVKKIFDNHNLIYEEIIQTLMKFICQPFYQDLNEIFRHCHPAGDPPKGDDILSAGQSYLMILKIFSKL